MELVSTVSLTIYHLNQKFLVTFEQKQSSGLGISVMIALLLHKVPEAFGFGSYLTVKGADGSLFINCILVSFI